MSIPGIPNNVQIQQANRQVLLTWSGSPGATGYIVNRSVDGVNFTVVATPAANSYLDKTVVVGTQYYYQVASSNTSGQSPFSTILSAVPTPTSEMSLGELRLKAKQRADLVNSQFITDPEWNSYINQSMFELYDILVETYDDYYLAPASRFVTISGQTNYPLPDGNLTFTAQDGTTFTPPPFYKLLGVDLAINNANNASVTVNKFNFIDRNDYIYPNTASTIYGVFNLKYRVMGNNLQFIPTPSSNQQVTIWFIPRLIQLLQDTDITTIGISGWLEYVIIRAAILALTKEESDSTSLQGQLLDVRKRIEAAAQNRDAGQPDTISSIRNNGYFGDGTNFGTSGSNGGY